MASQVHRNPSSLLPVIVSEEVNTSGLGKELLLLNWTVQHLQVAYCSLPCFLNRNSCMCANIQASMMYTYRLLKTRFARARIPLGGSTRRGGCCSFCG